MLYSSGFKTRLLGLCLVAIGASSAAWADSTSSAQAGTYGSLNSAARLAGASYSDAYYPPGFDINSDKKYPVVLLILGMDAITNQTIIDAANTFASRGFIAHVVSHDDSGNLPNPEDNRIANIKQAVANFRASANTRYTDTNRISAFGISAGGLFALHLGTDPATQIRCVGTLAAPSDLSSYINPEQYLASPPLPPRPTDPQLSDRPGIARGLAQQLFGLPSPDYSPADTNLSRRLSLFSPLRKVTPGINSQFYLIHATGDTLVPFSNSYIFRNRVNENKGQSGAAWCKSVGGDHESMTPSAWDQLSYFFKQCTNDPNPGTMPSIPAGMEDCPINSRPIPLICDIAASPSWVPASGGTVQLTSSCAGSATQYQWKVDGVLKSTTANSGWSYTVPANETSSTINHVVSVSASDSATGNNTPNPAQVIVMQGVRQPDGRPNCALTATPTSLTYTGGTVSLTGSCSGNPTSYKWMVDDVLKGTTTTPAWSHNVVANYGAGSTTIAFSLTATNHIGTSDPVRITVAQTGMSPVCTLSSSPSSLPSSGGTVTLTASCSNNPNSYQWSVNGVLHSGTTQPTWSWNAPSNSSATPTNIVFSMTASNSTAGAGSPAQVTVVQAGQSAAKPVCTISVSPTSMPHAGGQFSATASCTGNPKTYSWKINGGDHSQTTPPSFASSIGPNSGSSQRLSAIGVVASNDAGSSDLVQATITQAAMPVPSCSINIAPTSLPYTGGQMTATASCTGSPTDYDWYVGGGYYTHTSVPTWTDSVGVHQQASPHYFTVGVVAKNAAGSSNMAQVTVTQAAMPVPTCFINISPTSLPYTGGQLTATASCTGSPTGYDWYVGGGYYTHTSVPTWTDSVGVHQQTSPHYFTVGVIAKNAVGSSNMAQVTVTQAGKPATAMPTVAVYVNGANKTNGTTSIRTNQPFTFSYSSTNATSCKLTSTNNGVPWLTDAGIPSSKTYTNLYFPAGTHRVTVTCSGTGGSGSGVTTIYAS